MRLALMMALAIPGLMMLATPYLPLGLVFLWLGWWIYERSGMRDGDGFITLVLVLGGIGALAVVGQFLLQLF